MPLSVSILNIYGYEVANISGRNPVIIEARYIKKVKCPFCNGEILRKKDKYVRRLNHESIGARKTKLYLAAYKYHCLGCGRYFNQRFPGVLNTRDQLKDSGLKYLKSTTMVTHKVTCQKA